MAQGEERTEKPTAKKLSEARKQGQIARSQDIDSAMSMGALLLFFVALMPQLWLTLSDGFQSLLARSSRGPFDPGVGEHVLSLIVAALAPVLGLAVLTSLISGLAQTRGRLATGKLKLKLSTLSPKKGLSQLSPKKMLWELVRTTLKLALIIGVAAPPVQSVVGSVGVIRSLNEWAEIAIAAATSLLWRTLLLVTAIAAADYAYNWYTTNKQLKMTKQEVRDEGRAQEGDPQIKGRRRSKQRELSRNRVISAVSTADVVIVNPVRFAVALRYIDSDPAPRVVAKGAGAMARKIRTEAYRNGVAVRQDPPLARALFRRCQVGDLVPTALFEAVAVVLAAVYRRKWKRRSGAARSTMSEPPTVGASR